MPTMPAARPSSAVPGAAEAAEPNAVTESCGITRSRGATDDDVACPLAPALPVSTASATGPSATTTDRRRTRADTSGVVRTVRTGCRMDARVAPGPRGRAGPFATAVGRRHFRRNRA